MIRVVAAAMLAAAAAALILVQMQGTAELAFWEILLLLLVILQYRSIPDRGDPLEVPLFRLPSYEPDRLPRAIATSELAVVDAATGYLSPNRRLRPALMRIADHRLGRLGVEARSAAAVEALGEAEWNLLFHESDQPVAVEELESLVRRLERL
ncbi:MAG: hypothetical protein DWQ40_02435 [Actinobacteria bacterium]|nr:MAG: hypothetical protein DWQ40_02435 [Actinomycetota bacterium]